MTISKHCLCDKCKSTQRNPQLTFIANHMLSGHLQRLLRMITVTVLCGIHRIAAFLFVHSGQSQIH